nr:hypothetical protein [Tanacetum cinerariifolium]
ADMYRLRVCNGHRFFGLPRELTLKKIDQVET